MIYPSAIRAGKRALVILTVVVIGAGLNPNCARLDAQTVGVPVADVRIEISGPFGGRVQGATVRLLTIDRKRELPSSPGKTEYTKVPYGQYVVIASSSGGSIAERELAVNAKEIFVKVGVPFPPGDRAWPAGDLTLDGEIAPFPRDVNQWWVRVAGVFLHASRESPVDGSGHFSVGGLEMGTYVIEVFDDAKVRHVETVEIDPRSSRTHLKIALTAR